MAFSVVEGRIGALTAGVPADGRGVSTDYELAVTRVVQNGALLPVTVSATILVTRPGGEMERDAVRQQVRVAGYPTLTADARAVVTLLGIPDAGRFQGLSTSTRKDGHELPSLHVADCARSALSPEGARTSSNLCIEGPSLRPPAGKERP
jgi:hypothetical protein